MKLSEKKEEAIWRAINLEVLKARVSAAKILKGQDSTNKIDDVLFKLSIDAAEAACGVFKPQTNKSKNK